MPCECTGFFYAEQSGLNREGVGEKRMRLPVTEVFETVGFERDATAAQE